jgi:riboflavin kinase/FMN adenylyltransferase
MALRDVLTAAGIAGPSVVTIGTFDGVHLGHQHLVRDVARQARARSAVAVGLTFDPRPAEILRPDVPSLYLCTVSRRAELLRQAGLDRVVVVPFDRELSLMSAASFSETLVREIGMRELVGGPDLALGHRREGTPEVLRDLGQRLGFDLRLVPGFEIDGQPVRTRVIRQLLAEARLAEAEMLLGRRYSVDGTVVRGDGRGTTIGVPTANVATSPRLVLPGNGVYAVYFQCDGERWPGAANLGVRPTFDGQSRSLEIHLLDFSGNLYGKAVEVEFVQRLRPEQRFANVGELIAQIHRDIAKSREVLS